MLLGLRHQDHQVSHSCAFFWVNFRSTCPQTSTVAIITIARHSKVSAMFEGWFSVVCFGIDPNGPLWRQVKCDVPWASIGEGVSHNELMRPLCDEFKAFKMHAIAVPI